MDEKTAKCSVSVADRGIYCSRLWHTGCRNGPPSYLCYKVDYIPWTKNLAPGAIALFRFLRSLCLCQHCGLFLKFKHPQNLFRRIVDIFNKTAKLYWPESNNIVG
jgi:hypothetical protein